MAENNFMVAIIQQKLTIGIRDSVPLGKAGQTNAIELM